MTGSISPLGGWAALSAGWSRGEVAALPPPSHSRRAWQALYLPRLLQYLQAPLVVKTTYENSHWRKAIQMFPVYLCCGNQAEPDNACEEAHRREAIPLPKFTVWLSCCSEEWPQGSCAYSQWRPTFSLSSLPLCCQSEHSSSQALAYSYWQRNLPLSKMSLCCSLPSPVWYSHAFSCLDFWRGVQVIWLQHSSVLFSVCGSQHGGQT